MRVMAILSFAKNIQQPFPLENTEDPATDMNVAKFNLKMGGDAPCCQRWSFILCGTVCNIVLNVHKVFSLKISYSIYSFLRARTVFM